MGGPHATRCAIATLLAIAALAASPVRGENATPGPAPTARVIDAMPQGPSVDARLEEIRRLLQAALIYPPIARRRGLTGVAWVEFSIDPKGAARDVALARSSGHPILDRAARRTVDRVGRLPWVYGRIEVPIRFALEDPS